MNHTLYRFYDRAGALLYVGISSHLARRLDQHSRLKTWWTDIATMRVEHYPDRVSLMAAERTAIADNRPKHNVVHNRNAPITKPAWTGIPPMLQIGHVVALAMAGDACPIGLVSASDRRSAELEQYSWSSGRFDAGRRTVRYGDTRMLRFAAAMEPASATRLGYPAEPGYTIFDMDPLAEFQEDWKTVPMTHSEIREVKRRLAIPGFVGPFLDPKPIRPHRPIPARVPAVPARCPTHGTSGTRKSRP